MPDRYDNANFLDKAFEVAAETQKGIGQLAPDEVSFVMGFIACFGIVTGRVDVGIGPDEPLDTIFDAIHKDIVAFGRRVAANQRLQNVVRD